MAGIGNITRIEQEYMNAMIALSRAYRDNSKLIELTYRFKDDSTKRTLFIPKNRIVSIEKHEWQEEILYCVVTDDGLNCMIDKEQGEKLIKNW